MPRKLLAEIGRQVADTAGEGSQLRRIPSRMSLMRKVYDGLQQGKIDRSLFHRQCECLLHRSGAEGLCEQPWTAGRAAGVRARTRTSLRGGMTARIYEVKYPKKNLVIIIYQMPDGKIEQYLIAEQ